MKNLREYITLNESEVGNLRPTRKDELKELIRRRMNEQGPRCDLNDIDVSRVTDMSHLFDDTNFKGDISKWDVSNVKNMSSMFAYSDFNGDISKWDVSNVQDMSEMFANSNFSGDIDKWDVRRVANMRDIFYKSPLSPLKGKAPRWYKES